MTDIVITGGTGYIGTRLVRALLERGHRPRVLTRAVSAARVPDGAVPVIGDALDARSIALACGAGATLVHLVGTPHPNPAKAAEFVAVDLASIRACVAAAVQSGVAHLVYLSIAQPAPAMRAYLAARVQGERLIAGSGLRATILRPWYVLGPGHRWPVVLLPIYALAERVPVLRDGARRLGLVTLTQMVTALVAAVEGPVPHGIAVIDVPGIRAVHLDASTDLAAT